MKNSMSATASVIATVLVSTNLYCSQVKMAPAAGQELPVPRTYRGQIINAETVIGLAPQAPEAIKEQATQWLTKHPDFVNLAFSYEKLITLKDQTTVSGELFRATNAYLNTMDIKNMSPYNLVFPLPESKPPLLLKAGGLPNIRYNLNHFVQYLKMGKQGPWGKPGYDYQRPLSTADYEHFKKELHDSECDQKIQTDGSLKVKKKAPKTYQTISRIAHYLLFLDAQERHKFETVIAPKMYPIHIPGRPQEASDRNYIALEEEFKGLKEAGILSPKEEEELEIAIRETGLFNINRENVKRTVDGKLVIIDFEQPNNSIPPHFLYQDEGRFLNNMNAGLASFRLNFKQNKS